MVLRLKHTNEYRGHIFPIDAPALHLAYVAALEINPLMPLLVSIGDLTIDWQQVVPAEAFKGGCLIRASILAGKVGERIGAAIILDCPQEVILNGDMSMDQAVISDYWWARKYPGAAPIGVVWVDSSSIRIEVAADRANLQANIFTVEGDGEYPIYAVIIDGVGHGFFIDFEGLD